MMKQFVETLLSLLQYLMCQSFPEDLPAKHRLKMPHLLAICAIYTAIPQHSI